jgi:hypothetical protein
MIVIALLLSSNQTMAELVLTEHVMAITIQAAKLSMLAYDETEPNDTITHDYSGTKQSNTNLVVDVKCMNALHYLITTHISLVSDTSLWIF